MANGTNGTAGAGPGYLAMGRSFLLVFALLAACTSGSQEDLQAVKQARSVAAEWALVNEQAEAGKLTPVYVTSMHKWLRAGVRSAHSSLARPNSAYAQQMKALLAERPDAPPGRFRMHATALKRIEDGLESA